MYIGFDMLYVVLVLPAILFSVWAQYMVKHTFNKYSKVNTSSRITGRDAAQAVLDGAGVTGVRIERISGSLTDHFDPKANVIRLSDSVYASASVAAAGVAAHEAGHAIQYAKKYAPIHVRMTIVPLTNIGSKLSMPLVLIGLFIEMYELITIGILLFGLVVLFQLITLPVEFNASRRAVASLSGAQILPKDELRGAGKVLSAAALTYVGALAVSLAQLLRLLLLTQRRR